MIQLAVTSLLEPLDEVFSVERDLWNRRWNQDDKLNLQWFNVSNISYIIAFIVLLSSNSIDHTAGHDSSFSLPITRRSCSALSQ